METKLTPLWAVLGVLSVLATSVEAAGKQDLGLRINFGSCNNANLSQPLWPQIIERKPDAWIWGGDNIYADWRPRKPQEWYRVWEEDSNRVLEALPLPPWYGASPEKLRFLYQKQLNIPSYKQFLDAVGRENVYGLWDDHDFGINDGGKEYEFRKESQAEFLKFMGVPKDDPRWSREGVYTSTLLANGRVKLFLLDNRYHRDPYSDTGDMLGEEQWKWLEKELAETNADFNIIMNGIQILPRMFLRSSRGENWERMPKSRARLMKTLQSSEARGVFFLSGDVHMAELLSANFTCENGNKFVLPELTSSGMTHSWKTYPAPMTWAMKCAHRILPWQETMEFYLDLNFGELDFDKDFTKVTMRIYNANSSVQIEKTWHVDQLKPQTSFQSCQEVGFRGPAPSLTVQWLYVGLWFVTTLLPWLSALSLVGLALSMLYQTFTRSSAPVAKEKEN